MQANRALMLRIPPRISVMPDSEGLNDKRSPGGGKCEHAVISHEVKPWTAAYALRPINTRVII